MAATRKGRNNDVVSNNTSWLGWGSYSVNAAMRNPSSTFSLCWRISNLVVNLLKPGGGVCLCCVLRKGEMIGHRAMFVSKAYFRAARCTESVQTLRKSH